MASLLRLRLCVHNEDNFLNRTTMIVAYATVFYCILCGCRRESAAVRVRKQQHRRKLTQQRRQQDNNTAAEAITHKPI